MREIYPFISVADNRDRGCSAFFRKKTSYFEVDGGDTLDYEREFSVILAPAGRDDSSPILEYDQNQPLCANFETRGWLDSRKHRKE